MYACFLEIGRGFFEGVCGRNDQRLDSQDPPPPIRESSPASPVTAKGTGQMVCRLPRSLDQVDSLRHKLINVVVVAVLDARADASRPQSPQTVADPAFTEGSHAGGK
jgi:hypothetical protein